MTSITEGAITDTAHDAHVSPDAHASHATQADHHGGHGSAPAGGHGPDAHGQQHPLKLYLLVWALLFVLSTFSYLVDYFNFQGYARWTLILIFMFLKAGAIVAIFMHMAWERLALVYAILLPPLALTVFMGMMAFEGGYTNGSREAHFDAPLPIAAPEHEGAAAEPAQGAAVEHAREAAPVVAKPVELAAAPAAAPAEPSKAVGSTSGRHAWAPEWLTSAEPAPAASAAERPKAAESSPGAWAPEWLRK
jgi:cytochrome c oxidase subunit IV